MGRSWIDQFDKEGRTRPCRQKLCESISGSQARSRAQGRIMTPKEQKLNALQYELSRRFEAARVAQDALMAEQTRQGLAVTREFYTTDEWAAERIAERIELREITAAVIGDCRMKWLRGYVPTPLEKAMMG